MKTQIIEYRPPRIALAFILAATLLHWFTPLGELHLYAHVMLSIVLGAVGFGVMMWGWWLFKTLNTAICPTKKSDHLVTSGIYQVSRNPMYLGLVAMLFALALYVGSLPFYLVALVYFIIINNVFCAYEESKLRDTFGEAYLAYKNKVRRWL